MTNHRVSENAKSLSKPLYAPARRAGDLLFVSGQGPFDPISNSFVFGSVQEQTRLVLENIRKILESCGSSLEDVVKCSVFLANPTDFAAMNEVYPQFFPSQMPARTTVAATLVVPGMLIEIDCIAQMKSESDATTSGRDTG